MVLLARWYSNTSSSSETHQQPDSQHIFKGKKKTTTHLMCNDATQIIHCNAVIVVKVIVEIVEFAH